MLSEPSSGRRLVLAVSVGVVLVVLVAVGVYGLAVGASETSPSSPQGDASAEAASSSQPATESGSTSTMATSTTAPAGNRLPALPRTDDAVLYARAVAEVLLAWDTMSVLGPGDHARHVLDDADPAGLETPALASDLTSHLPTVEVWQQLRHQETVQAVTIDAAYIPAAWDDIATSDGAEHLRPGTVAVTIEATRHRAGVWFDEPATADHPTAFTVFLACRPAFDRCHTLRLSRPDEPLP